MAGKLAAAGLELFRVMVAPADVGGPERVSVPVMTVSERPTTVTDDSVNVLRTGASTVRVAVLLTVPSLAVITAEAFAATGGDFTLNVAVVSPASTVTVEGVVASMELEDRVTVVALGAAPLRVTVPVLGVPPVTVVGDRERLLRARMSIWRDSVLVTVPSFAVIIALVLAVTEEVLTWKVAVVAAAGMVTVGRTVASGELEDRATAVATGAGPSRVMVPVVEVPPVTAVGERERLLRVSGSTVRVAVLLTDPSFAVMTADTFAVTVDVLTVNVPVVAPAATLTVAGTVASAEFDDRVTVVPPVGAAVERVTVPVVDEPPMTLD